LQPTLKVTEMWFNRDGAAAAAAERNKQQTNNFNSKL